jgi:predicted MFS family arabinose efflux permease
LLAGGLGGLLGSLWTGAGAGLRSSWTTCSALSGLVALSLVAIPISSTLLLVQIACFGLACSFRSLFLPLLISMSMSAADPSQRGSTNGLLAAVFQLGTAIGGAIGAWLYSKDGSFVANVSVAVGLLFSAGLIFLRARGPAEVDA